MSSQLEGKLETGTVLPPPTSFAGTPPRSRDSCHSFVPKFTLLQFLIVLPRRRRPLAILGRRRSRSPPGPCAPRLDDGDLDADKNRTGRREPSGARSFLRAVRRTVAHRVLGLRQAWGTSSPEHRAATEIRKIFRAGARESQAAKPAKLAAAFLFWVRRIISLAGFRGVPCSRSVLFVPPPPGGPRDDGVASPEREGSLCRAKYCCRRPPPPCPCPPARLGVASAVKQYRLPSRTTPWLAPCPNHGHRVRHGTTTTWTTLRQSTPLRRRVGGRCKGPRPGRGPHRAGPGTPTNPRVTYSIPFNRFRGQYQGVIKACRPDRQGRQPAEDRTTTTTT